MDGSVRDDWERSKSSSPDQYTADIEFSETISFGCCFPFLSRDNLNNLILPCCSTVRNKNFPSCDQRIEEGLKSHSSVKYVYSCVSNLNTTTRRPTINIL